MGRRTESSAASGNSPHPLHRREGPADARPLDYLFEISIDFPQVIEKTWLGGRDSNPDTQIQNLQSYRWTTSQRGRQPLICQQLSAFKADRRECAQTYSTTYAPRLR